MRDREKGVMRDREKRAMRDYQREGSDERPPERRER